MVVDRGFSKLTEVHALSVQIMILPFRNYPLRLKLELLLGYAVVLSALSLIFEKSLYINYKLVDN